MMFLEDTGHCRNGESTTNILYLNVRVHIERDRGDGNLKNVTKTRPRLASAPRTSEMLRDVVETADPWECFANGGLRPPRLGDDVSGWMPL
jgi:hypothetical protein